MQCPSTPEKNMRKWPLLKLIGAVPLTMIRQTRPFQQKLQWYVFSNKATGQGNSMICSWMIQTAERLAACPADAGTLSHPSRTGLVHVGPVVYPQIAIQMFIWRCPTRGGTSKSSVLGDPHDPGHLHNHHPFRTRPS